MRARTPLPLNRGYGIHPDRRGAGIYCAPPQPYTSAWLLEYARSLEPPAAEAHFRSFAAALVEDDELERILRRASQPDLYDITPGGIS